MSGSPRALEAEYVDPQVIRIDGGTQARAVLLDEAHVEDVKERYLAGEDLPPVVVFYDGQEYWCADGHHRVAAARAADFDEVNVDLREGSREEAALYSCGANQGHGLKRSPADKRAAARLCMKLRPSWSDRKVADHCGIDHKTVADERERAGGEIPQVTEREGRDGKRYTVRAPEPFVAGPLIEAITAHLKRYGALALRPIQLAMARSAADQALGRALSEEEWRALVEEGLGEGLWRTKSAIVGGRLIGEIWMPAQPRPEREAAGGETGSRTSPVEPAPAASLSLSSMPSLWQERATRLVAKLDQGHGGSARLVELRHSSRESLAGLGEAQWETLLREGARAGLWTIEGDRIRLLKPADTDTDTDTDDDIEDAPEGPVLPSDPDDPAVQGHQAALEEGPWVDCPSCGGEGEEAGTDDDCEECGGDGGWHDRDTDDTDTDTDAKRTSLDEGHDSAAPGASESGRAGSVPDPVAPTHTTTHAEGADAAQAAAAGADVSGAERPAAPPPAHKKGTIGYVQEHIVRWLGSVNARGLGKRIEIDTIRSWLKRDPGVILSDREFAQIVRMGRESGLWDTDAADNIWLPAEAPAKPAKAERPRPSALPERLDPSLVDLRCCSASVLLATLEDLEADLVVLDGPWRYHQSHGASRADDHYPTMAIEDIAMNASSAYHKARRLAVWVTCALLGEWVSRRTPWGQPVTSGAWIKSREEDQGHYGQGYHWAGVAELVLIYTRDGSHTDRGSALRNGWIEPPGEHSCKPIGWQTQWIKRWVPEGGLVVDLYAGLGSVAHATLLAGGGRRYVGAELDPARHQRAIEGIEALCAREGA